MSGLAGPRGPLFPRLETEDLDDSDDSDDWEDLDDLDDLDDLEEAEEAGVLGLPSFITPLLIFFSLLKDFDGGILLFLIRRKNGKLLSRDAPSVFFQPVV